MRRLNLVRALIVAAAFFAGEASACLRNAVRVYIGGEPTVEEQRAEARQIAAYGLRLRTLEAKREWAGGIDAARELAELLVPNVRPVFIETSDCGDGEVDEAGGVGLDAVWHDWLSGTAYSGREKEFSGILRSEGVPLAWACNAEVRDRFAAYLRRRLSARELRDSYVFLAARRDRSLSLRRLMAFQGKTRLPPLRWIPTGPGQWVEIQRWQQRQSVGRALAAAIESFWEETTPSLADTARTCPGTYAAWRSDQAAAVKQIDAEVERRRGAGERSPAS